MSELLPYLALLVSTLACAISWWGAHRAGRWRQVDAAEMIKKATETRFGALKELIDDAHGRIDRHDDRFVVIESDLKDLPTRADFERLAGTVNTTCSISARTEKAVERLEHFMMERRT